jgi:hypothetical protein
MMFRAYIFTLFLLTFSWTVPTVNVKEADASFPFSCLGRTFESDTPISNVHGCDKTFIAFSTVGKAMLLTVHHGWMDTGESKTPYVSHFLELPDGRFYRFNDIGFLFHPRLRQYFDEISGRVGGYKTNITLEKFAEPHLDAYADTFCLTYHLKHPFGGKYGWCQKDTIMSGQGFYLDGAMEFTRAALLAYDATIEHNIAMSRGPFLSNVTLTAINTDINGWWYYAFAFAGVASPYEPEQHFVVRVFFDGRTEIRTLREKPENPDAL